MTAEREDDDRKGGYTLSLEITPNMFLFLTFFFLTPLDQQLFLENVYTEVQGKELVLATDHSCSLVLEKLLRASNDFQLRVFFDKFNGNFLKLFTHRFASHVCQTLITLCADSVEREVKSNELKTKV